MAYRILIVDDSTFFRRRIKQILEQDPELEVVGEAKNGLEAISSAGTLKPDVVTMDVEMPIMDGISAVKKIMEKHPVPIMMFSSLTHEGAQATLDALDAGAMDFIPKKFEDIALNRQDAIKLLQDRVKTLGKNNKRMSSVPLTAPVKAPTPISRSFVPSSTTKVSKSANNIDYACLAIGASTGGPVALQKILTELPADYPLPLFLVQHMPGTFTEAFSKRLDDLCQIKVKEAENGEAVKKGVCYIAPGGKQMTISGNNSLAKITISEPEKYPQAAYKPSVDVTFESISQVYGGNVLGVILTGMGSDGKDGCRILKTKGATIWAQNKTSCVVYGMPQAVASANISVRDIDINDMADSIKKETLS